MLRSLSIRDFVIVERMELQFSSGFTVLTGETGAGKSILVDALALVLGARGDAIAVRQGAERAEVSGDFEIEENGALARWLAENDLAEEPGTCLVRRVVDSTGRSRAFINGRSATLAQLRQAGESLVDIHGQHDHQSLIRAATQRELLDAFGGLKPDAARVADAYRTWREARERRVAFETNAAALAAEREALEWQANELQGLDLTADAWQSLLAEHSRLTHAASLIEGAQQAVEVLSEGEAASLAQVNGVIARLNNLATVDPRLKEILDVLEPARIQLQEAAYALRRYGERLELDPRRLHELERRLEAIHAASRKYRLDPEALPEALGRARRRLAEIQGIGGADAQRKKEEDARSKYLAAAEALSAARNRAAKRLGEQVTRIMQKLAMEGGRFEIALLPLEEPASHGLEQAEFRVAAHKGMAPQPLAKVASGGELSRLSLAIQSVASEVASVPTLVFDEVDAGIGGRVAEIVGRLLKELGTKYQVMCITHLPQVAAAADRQWQVSKSSANGRVSSKVTALDAAQRVEEIARMLGGVKITETTRKHAAEMLGLKS